MFMTKYFGLLYLKGAAEWKHDAEYGTRCYNQCRHV